MKIRQKNIAIIGTVGLPAQYGGFETLTEHLVNKLGDDFNFTVYCSGKKYKVRNTHYKKAKLTYLPFEANGIQSIIYDSISIIHSLFYADVLLILGVAGAWLLPFVRLFTNKKIIISIDGIEWKRAKWNIAAQLYLFWAEALAVKFSHIDISDNEAIQDYTAMRYNSLSRIIEYGADHVQRIEPAEESLRKYPFILNRYAFKVCRIEPENNVHVVLAAYSDITDHSLVIVGNWNNSDYGKKLKAKYCGYQNIFLLDPIYDQAKLDEIRGNASIYIHGHSAGGTNPSLVEAMMLGLPIIAYSVSYNKVTTEEKALYFKTKEHLKQIVMNTSISQFDSIASNMASIAKRRYTWDVIAQKYNILVNEVLEAKSKTAILNKYLKLNDSELINLEIGHLKHSESFFIKR